jgi:hypothetical protein
LRIITFLSLSFPYLIILAAVVATEVPLVGRWIIAAQRAPQMLLLLLSHLLLSQRCLANIDDRVMWEAIRVFFLWSLKRRASTR